MTNEGEKFPHPEPGSATASEEPATHVRRVSLMAEPQKLRLVLSLVQLSGLPLPPS